MAAVAAEYSGQGVAGSKLKRVGKGANVTIVVHTKQYNKSRAAEPAVHRPAEVLLLILYFKYVLIQGLRVIQKEGEWHLLLT